MRVTLIFRKPTKGQYSIEKVFKPLIPIFKKSYELDCVFLPHHTSGITNLFRNLFFLRKLPKSDVYHITGDVHYAALSLPKKKTLLTIHDLNSIIGGKGMQDFVKRLLWFNLPLKNSRFITCISRFTGKELSNQFNIDERKLKVIHNPIEGVQNDLPKSKAEVIEILQIGTKINKNLDRLIKALEGIKCRLLIVGKLNTRQKELLTRYNIGFENFVDISDNEMHDLYQQCDIVSFISTYEGFGMPVLEAQSFGRPVLASTIEPIKEVSGDAVQYVNPKDNESIKRGVKKLIDNEDLRAQLIEEGFENVKHFTPEKIAQSYIELYKTIAES